VIDGKTNKVIGNVKVGNTPSAVAVNPNTNMVYVTNYYDNTTSVIDGKTNKVIGNVTVGSAPSALAVNPNTNMVYVTSDDINQLSVFNPDQGLK